MFTNLIVINVRSIYVYQIITLCALNLHNVMCELYVNKAGRGKDSRTDNKFKDTSVEIIQPEEQRDKRLKKNGQSLRDV